MYSMRTTELKYEECPKGMSKITCPLNDMMTNYRFPKIQYNYFMFDEQEKDIMLDIFNRAQQICAQCREKQKEK